MASVCLCTASLMINPTFFCNSYARPLNLYWIIVLWTTECNLKTDFYDCCQYFQTLNFRLMLILGFTLVAFATDCTAKTAINSIKKCLRNLRTQYWTIRHERIHCYKIFTWTRSSKKWWPHNFCILHRNDTHFPEKAFEKWFANQLDLRKSETNLQIC